MATKLHNVLQESADYIFRDMKLCGDWKAAMALAWSTTCQLSPPTTSPSLPIHFLMYKNKGRWKVSKYQLEAAIGLWWWSLKQLPDQENLFSRKVMVVEKSQKMVFSSAIRLWVTQTDDIKESSCPLSINPSGVEQISTPLSMPLLGLKDSRADRSAAGSENRVLLSVETRSSPLQMVAQEIFAIFISRIADILEPLKEATPREARIPSTNPLGVSPDRPYLGLVNTHVESIADRLVAAGIGSREDALMSIIPSLLQSSKLPHIGGLMEDLLSRAKSLRRSGKFDVGEDLLKGLLHLGPLQLQERAVRSLGELYRAAVRSRKPSDQDFGRRGFKKMRQTCDMPILSDQAKHILGHYEIVGNYFEGRRNSGETGQALHIFNSEPQEFLKDLENQPARSRGLTLTDEIDLSKEDPADVLQILRWAIEQNCPELVEDLWQVDSTLIHTTDGEGQTPTFWAISCEAETFQRLLEWPNIQVDAHDRNGRTPLFLASEKGCHKVVDLLLRQGANARVEDQQGWTPLSFAVENGHEKVVSLLAQGEADLNMPLGRGNSSALAVAINKGHTEIVKLLVQEGKADVNMPLDRWGYGSALAAAVCEGQTEIVKFLVQEGKVDVNMRLQRGDYGTALEAAAYCGRGKCVEVLIKGGADVSPTVLEASKAVITEKDYRWFWDSRDLETLRRDKDEVAALLKRHGATASNS